MTEEEDQRAKEKSQMTAVSEVMLMAMESGPAG
jgi:hypothetical protein